MWDLLPILDSKSRSQQKQKSSQGSVPAACLNIQQTNKIKLKNLIQDDLNDKTHSSQKNYISQNYNLQWGFQRPCEELNQFKFIENISYMNVQNNPIPTFPIQIISECYENQHQIDSYIQEILSSDPKLSIPQYQKRRSEKSKLQSKKRNKKHFKRDKNLQEKNLKKKSIQKRGRKPQVKKSTQKGETKNTIKNFGKELIKFIHQNRGIVEKARKQIQANITYQQLDQRLQTIKKSMSKKSDLLKLWDHEDYGKLVRVITCTHFRKYCYHWIFNSRVKNYSSALKYKSRLNQMLKNPTQVKNLKCT